MTLKESTKVEAHNRYLFPYLKSVSLIDHVLIVLGSGGVSEHWHIMLTNRSELVSLVFQLDDQGYIVSSEFIRRNIGDIVFKF